MYTCTLFNVLCSCGFTDTDGLIQAGEMARRRRSQSRSRRSSRSSCEPPPPLVEPNIQSCHASDDQQTLVDAQCKFVVIIIICITFHLPLKNFFNFFPSLPFLLMFQHFSIATLSLLLPKVHAGTRCM